VHPQACDNVLLGLAQISVNLLQLLPLLELGAQLLDLLCDARPAHVLLALLLGERGRGRGGVVQLLGEGGLGLLWLLARQSLAVLGEVLCALLAQLLQLGRQALLVGQLLRFRARSIRLVRASALVHRRARCIGGATYKGVLLQRVYQLIREADGAVSARKLISIRTSLAGGRCSGHSSHWGGGGRLTRRRHAA
jgi:hypothetical protein